SIPVFTGCRYTSAQWSKVASPIAKFLRDRPDLVVQFSASGSSSWNSTFILKVQHDVAANQERLATYLIEKEGFGKERIRTDFSNNYDHARKGVSLIHFRFLSHAEAFAAAPKKKLRGLYVYKDDNGHCSSSIRLLRDGKYYIESGCEDRSSISFGQYEATEDELWLTPANNTEPAYEIVITDTTTNYGFIRLIDKDGLALSAFSLRTLTPGYLDTMRDSQVQYPDSNGYFILPSRGDINFTFNRNIKDIEVSPVFSQWKELKNTGSKVYTLRFNYPLSSLGYSYIQNLFGYELKYTYDYRKLVSRDGRIFLHQGQK
ncbi:MAG: hypothetical protein ABIQ56_07705, partial [Chitinophagaceae bacterium]